MKNYWENVVSTIISKQWSFIKISEVNSTNELGKKIIKKYKENGNYIPSCVVIAEGQKSGRGRSGRVWISPKNMGLYVSFVFPYSSESISSLPYRIGVAVADTISGLGISDVRVKWPNDVYINGAKVAGSLIEVIYPGPSCIVGVGINVSPQNLELDREIAFVNQFLKEEITISELLLKLFKSFLKVLESSREEVFKSYRSFLRLRSGEAIKVRIGSKIVDATFVNLTDDGRFIVKVGEEERVLLAEEVIE